MKPQSSCDQISWIRGKRMFPVKTKYWFSHCKSSLSAPVEGKWTQKDWNLYHEHIVDSYFYCFSSVTCTFVQFHSLSPLTCPYPSVHVQFLFYQCYLSQNRNNEMVQDIGNCYGWEQGMGNFMFLIWIIKPRLCLHSLRKACSQTEYW